MLHVYDILGKYVHHFKKNHCPQKSTVISNFVSHHNFSIKMHAFIIYKWNSTDLQVKHFKKFPCLHNIIFHSQVALIRRKRNVFCRGTNHNFLLSTAESMRWEMLFSAQNFRSFLSALLHSLTLLCGLSKDAIKDLVWSLVFKTATENLFLVIPIRGSKTWRIKRKEVEERFLFCIAIPAAFERWVAIAKVTCEEK